MGDLLLQGGDLVADKYGDISLCADENNDIVQMANTNILLRLGGNKFHSELGNNAFNRRIKANESGIEIVQSECINAIMNCDPRVREVKQINVTLSNDATCIVDYILVYATSSSSIELDEDEEELIEVDGRTYVDIFNMKGGE